MSGTVRFAYSLCVKLYLFFRAPHPRLPEREGRKVGGREEGKKEGGVRVSEGRKMGRIEGREGGEDD